MLHDNCVYLGAIVYLLVCAFVRECVFVFCPLIFEMLCIFVCVCFYACECVFVFCPLIFEMLVLCRREPACTNQFGLTSISHSIVIFKQLRTMWKCFVSMNR